MAVRPASLENGTSEVPNKNRNNAVALTWASKPALEQCSIAGEIKLPN